MNDDGTDTAFISERNYTMKEERLGGAGIVAASDEFSAAEDSASECRNKNIRALDRWFTITIPSRKYFLDYELPIQSQSEEVKSALADQESVRILFADKLHDLQMKIDRTAEGIAQNERLGYAMNAIAEFQAECRGRLLGFDSGRSFIDFVRSRCIKDNSDDVSSFLYHIGIKGIIFSDEKSVERLLILSGYDDISVLEINCGHSNPMEVEK